MLYGTDRRRQGESVSILSRPYALILAAATILLASTVSAEQGDITRFQVAPTQDDCVNTYIIRLLVAASNNGASLGEFEGARYMLRRTGTSMESCGVEMRQFNATGALEDIKSMRCMFENPLGKGGGINNE